MTRILSVFVPCAIVAAVLVGCTPIPGPTSGPSTSPSASSASPSPTATAAGALTPQPVLDIDCARLASDGAITAAFGATVSSVDPLITQGLSTNALPDAFVFQTLGGITCEWNNGVPFVSAPGSPPYVGAQLTIMPNAASQWARYLANLEDTGVFCPTSDPQLWCDSEQLIGTTWVSLVMQGVVSQAQARSLAASVNAVVAAAGPGAAPWTPPSTTRSFGDCSSLLTPAQAASAMRVTGASINFAAPAGGWSIQAGARVNADAMGCLLKYTDEDSVPGVVNWLRGGEWAYDAAAGLEAWGTNAPAPLDLAKGDRARIRCTDATTVVYVGQTVCTVDLALSGNWIQVIYEPVDGDHASAPARDGALALAADVATGFYTS